MKEGEELAREQLHLQELAIAQLTSVYVNSQKTKPPYTSPKDFCLFRPSEQRFSPILCRVIKSLLREKKLPNWVIGWLPHDELTQGDTLPDHAVPVKHLRALMAPGVVIFSPNVTDNYIKFPLALIEGVQGSKRVYCIDTREHFDIEIPSVFDEFVLDEIWERVS